MQAWLIRLLDGLRKSRVGQLWLNAIPKFNLEMAFALAERYLPLHQIGQGLKTKGAMLMTVITARSKLVRRLVPTLLGAIMFATPVAASAAFPIAPNVSSMVETLANEYSAAQQKAALLANFAATSTSSAIKTAANDAAQVSADTYKFVTSADSFLNASTTAAKDQAELAVQAADAALTGAENVFNSDLAAAEAVSSDFASLADSFWGAVDDFNNLVVDILSMF